MTLKRGLSVLILAGIALAGLLVLAAAGLRETGETNSYALLAEAFLHGRLDTTRCFDTDCALFDGRTYVIFPPVPAVIAMPFVALFGADFSSFIPLTLLAYLGSGYLWWRIAERLTASRDLTVLLTLLVLFATPLFFVALRGDRVWFFAQSWGFLFSTAAIYAAMIRRSALLAGLFIGLAFLSRQMTILYLPFLFVLLKDDSEPLFRINGEIIGRAFKLAVFPLAALAVYFIYNQVRFGSPLDTGYGFIFQGDPGDGGGSFVRWRSRELGSFAPDYFLFNLIYMFFQGPHAEFSGRYMTELTGFDRNGAGLFVVTPVLLMGFLAKWNRVFWIGLSVAGAILTATLFYHSNGYSQFSAQRYALDWLPILLVFAAAAAKREYTPLLTLFVIYSMVLTIGMTVVGAIAQT